MKIGKQSYIFNNVYLYDSFVSTGPLEAEGPLKKYFDHSYSDMYFGEKSWEKAEIKMMMDSICGLIRKTNVKNIDCVISGDLVNQNVISNYVMRNLIYPHIGIYSACSTAILGIIIAAFMLESENANYIITTTSSHNSTSERQFRNPTEYGGSKPKSATYTVTGCAANLIAKKGRIKISRATLGRVIDVYMKDPLDMGSAMAPAACEVLLTHLNDFSIDIKEYDLVLTGDLSLVGKRVVKSVLFDEKIDSSRYDDCGLLIYDIEKQPVFAGGSGCACIGVVSFSYVRKKILDGTYKKVLLIATGALMNPIILNQQESIPAIAHAITLERTIL